MVLLSQSFDLTCGLWQATHVSHNAVVAAAVARSIVRAADKFCLEMAAASA